MPGVIEAVEQAANMRQSRTFALAGGPELRGFGGATAHHFAGPHQ